MTPSPLPLAERWFMKARRWTAPLEAIAAHAPSGNIADIGCGHGALAELLARGRSDRQVYGVDPDPRKIGWARSALATLANVTLMEGSAAEASKAWGSMMDAVVVADVLYLLPLSEWAGFLQHCRSLMRPGGVLLLKEAEANGTWKHKKCVTQERIMVQLLRRTRSSGGLGLATREQTTQLLAAQGFVVERVIDLSRGYTTPHILFVARAANASA